MSEPETPLVSKALFRGLLYGVPLSLALWAAIIWIAIHILGT